MKISRGKIENELSRRRIIDFTKKTYPKYNATDFHKVYGEVLDRFIDGSIKKLIITVPPQHGKSELSTRRLPAKMLGNNPDLHIAIASYSATHARRFNREVQQIIDDPVYRDVYPDTRLSGDTSGTKAHTAIRTTDEFEIVNHKGGLKAVGRGGALTGSAVDVMIMDDLYKDHKEANSPVVREAVKQWYKTVVKTRLHNESQELIVFTRWHEEDLIGWLEENEEVITIGSIEELDDIGNAWAKINFEAIKESEKTEIDPREEGEALWPDKHSYDKLTELRRLDREQFSCLFQGNPESKEGMLYDDFKTYDTLPDIRIKKNYTDTADTGEDYLCSINYGVGLDDKIYILDVLYTQKPMEETEKLVPSMLDKDGINEADIESNNGGRSFARVVEEKVDTTVINWFHQSENKEARIYSQNARVTRLVMMPNGWEERWPKFYKAITKFKKQYSANQFKDAPDALTGVLEKHDDEQGVLITW